MLASDVRELWEEEKGAYQKLRRAERLVWVSVVLFVVCVGFALGYFLKGYQSEIGWRVQEARYMTLVSVVAKKVCRR